MKYRILRQEAETYTGYLHPKVTMTYWLGELVNQGMVEKGDKLEILNGSTSTLLYTGDKKWRSLGQRGGLSGLELNVSTLNLLSRKGVVSLKQITEMRERDFLNNFGKRALHDVKEGLRLVGQAFRKPSIH